MGRVIATLTSSDRPLCPNSFGWPKNPMHETRTRLLDAWYEKAPKDSDNEMSKEVGEVYYAAQDKVNDYMNLYEHTTSFVSGREFVTVDAYYFQCPTCGFVLPAHRRPS